MKKPFLLGIGISPVIFILAYWFGSYIDYPNASNTNIQSVSYTVDDLIKYNFIPASGDAKDISFGYTTNTNAKDDTLAQRNLSSFKGKPVVLHFWAKWCPSCVREMPSMDRFYKKYGNQVNFIALAVDGDANSIKKFYKDQNYENLPIAIDSNRQGARSYGISSLPTTVFLDSNGKLVGRIIGPVSWNRGPGADIMKVLYNIK